MASPRLALAVFVLMLAVIALTEGMRGAGPKSCCTRFNDKPMRKERVKGYIKTSQQCPTPAVKFTTVAGRQLCVRASEPWVKKLISDLDAKSATGNTSNL